MESSLGGSENDLAYAIEQTVDGGFVVAGGSVSSDKDVDNNNGSSDCWILKFR